MPPRKKKYGTTWWGEKFIESMEGCDNANRLPRGITYANKGSAYNLKIDGSRITANVQGSDPTPYRVSIDFENFCVPAKKQSIVRILQKGGVGL